MKSISSIFILLLALTICLFPVKTVNAQPSSIAPITLTETDNNDNGSFFSLFYFFDLRDRETLVRSGSIEK